MGEESDILIVDLDSADDSKVGSRLGDYELLEKIGSGATCNVYRARHVTEGSEVAIKILELTPNTRRTHVQRMRREAAVSSRVDHPNLVRVYEFQREPAKCAYLVMELVRGKTLHELLCEEGPFNTARAARVIRETAAGLVAAHGAGYVHRDLKPGNLMLHDKDGVEHAKILDFGIVGAAKEPGDTVLTEEHSILGTPTYMAPEQLESPNVGPAADLYALGGILYHMLAGRPPFSGSFREIVAQQMVATPDPLPYADGLGPLAHWLLEKAPEKRPESAAQVVQLADTIIADIAAKKNIGPLALEVPATPLPKDVQLADWSTLDSWTGPIRKGFSRVIHWPLRITIPLVSIVAVAGGAFAARQFLGEHSGQAPHPGIVAEAPVIPGVPIARGEDIALTAPRAMHAPRRDVDTPYSNPGEPSARDNLIQDRPAVKEQVLEFSDPAPAKNANGSPKKALVQGADIMKDKSIRRYATRLSDPDMRALHTRLSRVDAAIKRASGTIPKPQLKRFEDRYKSLASMVRPELGELGRDGLVSHIEMLSAQIATTDQRYRN